MPPFFSPYGTDAISVGIPYWLDLLTVIIGAISGILVARDRHLDLVGFVGLGLLGGLGGGLIRDVMMQEGGVYMLNSPYAIPAAVFTAVLLFMFPEPLDRFSRMLEWTDIISVGLFAVVGTDKALVYHLLPFSVILMGSITGVGGGMLRDVFLGDIPRIFQRSNLYAFLRSCWRHLILGTCFLRWSHQNLGSRCLRCSYRLPEALVAQVQRAFSGRCRPYAARNAQC